ncbi:hypothetical protein D3C81_1333260 [compost metagenome]
MFVPNILDRERDDLQPHFLQVASRHALYFLRELIAVPVHFLDGHRTQNRTQMAFKHFLCFAFERFDRFAHKLLGRRRDVLDRAPHLDNGHSVSGNRHALLGVNLRCHHVQFVGEQRHEFGFLEYRPDKRPAAADDFDFTAGLVIGYVLAP